MEGGASEGGGGGRPSLNIVRGCVHTFVMYLCPWLPTGLLPQHLLVTAFELVKQDFIIGCSINNRAKLPGFAQVHAGSRWSYGHLVRGQIMDEKHHSGQKVSRCRQVSIVSCSFKWFERSRYVKVQSKTVHQTSLQCRFRSFLVPAATPLFRA